MGQAAPGGGCGGSGGGAAGGYDVDEPTALQDTQAFLDALRQLNIV